MSILHVFYSLEGNCRALSAAMVGATGGEIAALRPVRPVPEKFFGKYYAGCKGALLRERWELAPPLPETAGRELAFVGGPVWAWNMAPPLREFLAGRDWSGVRMALFVMCRGVGGFALPAMRALAERGGGTVVGVGTFMDLRMGDGKKTLSRAVDWARRMLEADGQGKHHDG